MWSVEERGLTDQLHIVYKILEQYDLCIDCIFPLQNLVQYRYAHILSFFDKKEGFNMVIQVCNVFIIYTGKYLKYCLSAVK
jgi:hypothetical protein